MRDRAWRDALIVFAFAFLASAPLAAWLGVRPDLKLMNAGPSFAHPLGCDSLGRDLLVRVASALREAVLPLWGAVACAALAGAGLGLLASLAAGTRGRAAALAAVADMVMAFLCGLPAGVAVFAWAALREEAGLAAVILGLVPLAAALAYLRVRDLARRDAALGYWEAHAAGGGAPLARLLRYGALGSWRGALADHLGFLLRVAVAVEAALGYLGFGVQEPRASLGNILAAHFEQYLRGDWRVLAAVAAALALAAAFPPAALRASARVTRLIAPRFASHSSFFSGASSASAPTPQESAGSSR